MSEAGLHHALLLLLLLEKQCGQWVTERALESAQPLVEPCTIDITSQGLSFFVGEAGIPALPTTWEL